MSETTSNSGSQERVQDVRPGQEAGKTPLPDTDGKSGDTPGSCKEVEGYGSLVPDDFEFE